MSRKLVLEPYAILSCDLSQALSVSSATSVKYLDNVGLTASWSGVSPTGQLFIEVLDPASGAYVPLDFGAQILIAGNTGSHLITINQLPFTQIRARYVGTGGTGTLNVTIMSKAVGA